MVAVVVVMLAVVGEAVAMWLWALDMMPSLVPQRWVALVDMEPTIVNILLFPLKTK